MKLMEARLPMREETKLRAPMMRVPVLREADPNRVVKADFLKAVREAVA